MDVSPVDVKYEQVTMEVGDEDVLNKSNYDLLCKCIDKTVGRKYASWRFNFAIIDKSNGGSLLGSDDLIRILKKHMENDNSTASSIFISLKMKALSQSSDVSSKPKNYDSEEELNKLKIYQSYWNDKNQLGIEVNNCDEEMDFICTNLQNIRQCVEILTDECKIELTKEQVMSETDKSGMEKRFDHLLESLEMEGLGTTHIYEEVGDAKENALQRDWTNAFVKIKNVLGDLRPFDIKKMLHLYDQTAAAAQRVKGKDICLLLGHTGAGKSTTIHFLAGSKMVQDPKSLHIFPTDVKTEELKKIATMQKVTESVTRFVSSAPLNLHDVGIYKYNEDARHKIELCDTPGFNDSEGPEMDVSNGLGIVKAVSLAKSVKVLMVISKGNIDGRMTGVKDLADTVAKLISDFETYYENGAIALVFTHMQGMDGKTVKYLFDLGYKEMKVHGGSDDKALMALFNAVMDSDDDPIVIDPLTSDRKAILKNIFNVKKEWIENAPEVFKSFVTASSLAKINQQALKHKEKIVLACSNTEKMNLSVINSKLYDMKRLTEVLPDSQEIVSHFQASLITTSTAWNKRCQRVMKPFKDFKYIDERSISGFGTDIELYSVVIGEAHKIEKLRKEYFSDRSNNNHEENGVNNLVCGSALYETLSKMFNWLLNNLSLNSESQSKWEKTKILLNKFQEKFEAQFNCRKTDIVEELKTKEKNLNDMIEQDRYDTIGDDIANFGDSLFLDALLGDKYEMRKKYNELVLRLEKKLDGHSELIIKHFGKRNQDLKYICDIKPGGTIENCDASCKAIEIACQRLNLQLVGRDDPCNICDKAQQVYNQCIKVLINYCETFAYTIGDLALRTSQRDMDNYRNFQNDGSTIATDTSSGGGGRMNQIKPMMKQMIRVRLMSNEVKTNTCQAYYKTIEQIIGYLENIRLLFNNSMREIANNSIDAEYDILIECINILKGSNWIFMLRDSDDSGENSDEQILKTIMNNDSDTNIDDDNELMTKVSNRLDKYTEKLMSRTVTLRINLETPECVDQVNNILIRLDKMKDLFQTMPNIMLKANNIYGILESGVREELIRIQSEFNLKNVCKGNLTATVKVLENLRSKQLECEKIFSQEGTCNTCDELIKAFNEKIKNINSKKRQKSKEFTRQKCQLRNRRSSISIIVDKFDKAAGGKSTWFGVASSRKKDVPTPEQQRILDKEGKKSRQEFLQAMQQANTSEQALESEFKVEEKAMEDNIDIIKSKIDNVKEYKSAIVQAQNNGFKSDKIDMWKQSIETLGTEIATRKSNLDKIERDFAFSEVFNAGFANQCLEFVDKCGKISWIKGNNVETTVKTKTKDSNEENEDKEDKKEELEGENLSLSKEIKITQRNLREYIKQYVTDRDDIVKTALNFIADTNIAKQDLAQMNKKGEELEKGIRELSKIHASYPYVNELLNEIIGDKNDSYFDDLVLQIDGKYNTLRESMERMKNMQSAELQVGVSQARVLGKMDRFVKNDNYKPFCELAFQYSQHVYGGKDFETLLRAIHKEDFATIGAKLQTMSERSDVEIKQMGGKGDVITKRYNQGRKMVAEKLGEILEDCRLRVIRLRNNVDLSQVEELRRGFNKVKEAKLANKSHLCNIDGSNTNLDNLEKEAKESLTKWIFDVLQRSTDSIARRRFLTFETKIQAVRTTYELLGRVFDEGKVDKEIRKAETLLEDKIKEIKHSYEAIEFDNKSTFSPYTQNPPSDLYTELEKVFDKRGIYSELWNEVEKDITLKFRKKLDETKTNYREAQIIIRKCTSIVRHLPKRMQNTLEPELKAFEEDIKINREMQNKRVEDVLNNENFNELRKLFIGAQKQNDDESEKSIRTKIVLKLRAKSDKIKPALTSLDANCVCESLEEMIRIRENFVGNSHGSMQRIDEIDQFLTNARNIIDIKCKEIVDTIGRGINTAHVINAVQLKNLEKQLDFMAKLNVSARSRRKKIFGDDFSATVKGLIDILNKFFDKTNCSFKCGLQELEVKKIEYAIKISEFHQKKTFISTAKQIDGVKIDLADTKEMKIKVLEKIKNLKNSIDEIQVWDIKNTDKNERDSFYTKLRKDVFALKSFDILNDKLSDYGGKMNIKKQYVIPSVTKMIIGGFRFGHNAVTQLTKDILEENGLKSVNVIRESLMSVYVLQIIAKDDIDVTEAKKVLKEDKIIQEKDDVTVGIALKTVDSAVTKKLKLWKRRASENIKNYPKMAIYLIQLEMARDVFTEPRFVQTATKAIDDCIRQFQKTKKTTTTALRQALETSEFKHQVYGNRLIDRHPAFAGDILLLFNQRTHARGMDCILEEIDASDKINKKKLSRYYTMFQNSYEKEVRKNLRAKLDLATLVSNTISKANNIRSQHKHQMEIQKKMNTRKQGYEKKLDVVETVAIENKNANLISLKGNVRQKIVELMANVFALWTLRNSKHYFEAKCDGNGDDMYLKKPRVAQVISIFRLLSIDDESGTFVRNLIEIGTGEGKSLTLAITACILALIGYHVSCACYSKYLSARDYKEYEFIFAELGVSKYIMYGTFNELCESVINDGGNVRELVLRNMNFNKISNENDDLKNNDDDSKSGGRSYAWAAVNYILDLGSQRKEGKNRLAHETRDKILLIDEVDVFFGDKFYGKVYTPGAVLKHRCINAVTDYIWHNRDFRAPDLHKIIQNSDEYKGLCSQFNNWKNIIDEAIKDMIVDVKQFDKSNYIVDETRDKIGYKIGDTIDTRAKEGYQTLFAYYFENSRGRISKNSLQENIGIYLNCGAFSYAEIPSEFSLILGVTGTLKTLSQTEKDAIKQSYGVSKYTYMPSLYGKSKFRFDQEKDVHLCCKSRYDENLKREIVRQLEPKPNTERCVFVFFQDRHKLESFYKSYEFISTGFLDKDKVVILSEDTIDNHEKDSKIKSATRSGKIAFVTKAFGRGTDFKILDTQVRNNYGAHVIQTFFSDTNSEEKQIQGRTARQGEDGSYSMVLLDESLETFGVTKSEVKEAFDKKELYQFLKKQRKKLFEEKYKTILKEIEAAKINHEHTMKLLRALKEHNVLSVNKYLLAYNLGAAIKTDAKVIVMIDATASMGPLITTAKTCVVNMCQRISSILEENGRDARSFQLKIVGYRNYDAPSSDIVKYSGWSSDAQKLKTFLDNLVASYGWGREAVEIGFQHIIHTIKDQKDEVSDIILIGDAAPNTKEDVIRKRKKREKEWNEDDFYKTQCYYQDQLDFFKEKKIAIHTFYLKLEKAKQKEKETKKAFETIANKTGGSCASLDMKNEEASSNTLTDIVCVRVLHAAGGDVLVQEYTSKFVHT